MSEDIENPVDENQEKNLSCDEIMQKLSEIETKVHSLLHYRDHYFEKNSLDKAVFKNNDIDSRKLEILKEFDSINDDVLVGIEKANYYFLKGKLLNVSAEFDQKSIAYLSKAVKLNPKLGDAWNELGEGYWKDKNMKEAKNCFEAAIVQSRNSTSLRNLSVVLRQFPTSDFNERIKNIQKSIELAKEALNFSLSDGLSWLGYGNALLYSYFSICQDDATLQKVLKAYKMAEGHKITANQSDLHFNKGMALKYSEEYSDALFHFELAKKLEPDWEPPGLEREMLVKYLNTVVDSLNSKGKLKAKKITEMVRYLYELAKTYPECIPSNSSEIGICKGKTIIGKVISSVRSSNCVPFSFCLIDYLGYTILVTVYNLASSAGVIIGDLIKISDPNFKKHVIVLGATELKFCSVRVDNPAKIEVNGKCISVDKIAKVSILSSYRT